MRHGDDVGPNDWCTLRKSLCLRNATWKHGAHLGLGPEAQARVPWQGQRGEPQGGCRPMAFQIPSPGKPVRREPAVSRGPGTLENEN